MKSDIEKTIDARVAAAFDDILPDPGSHARSEVLKGVHALVRTVWIGKIYDALAKDKTTIPQYFLDAELEQFFKRSNRGMLLSDIGDSRAGKGSV